MKNKQDKDSSQYIHGSSKEEQQRLSILNRILNRNCLEKINLEGVRRVLDVGSGLGQFSREILKSLAPGSSLLGIERDPEQLNEAIRLAQSDDGMEGLEFRPGSALDLPLKEKEIGSFDLVHARFLLEHLKSPEKSVMEMVRACKPGGRIVLIDDDHPSFVLSPEPIGFQMLWQAYQDSYHRLGNDPLIGRKMVSLMHRCGIQPIRNDLVFFGSCQGRENWLSYPENLIGILEGAKSFIIKEGLISNDNFEDGISSIRTWAGKPDAALWYGIYFAEGLKV